MAGAPGCEDGDVDCDDIREAISARLDGEDPALELETIATHLALCPACRRWETDAIRLSRLTRAALAEAVADRSAAILAAIRATVAPSRRRLDPLAVRGALAALGLLQLLLGAPALVLGMNGGAPVHLARELGSFDLALAVGFVFAAWRPVCAQGMLPFAAALVAGLAGGTVADVVRGQVSALAESAHLSQLIALGFVWLVARLGSDGPGRTRRPKPRPAADGTWNRLVT